MAHHKPTISGPPFSPGFESAASHASFIYCSSANSLRSCWSCFFLRTGLWWNRTSMEVSNPWGYPCSSSDNGIFHEIIHEIIHPAIGVPPWLRKPSYMGVSEDEVAVYPKNVHFRRDMLPSFSGKPIWGHNLWPRDCRFCLLHVSDKRSYFSVRTQVWPISIERFFRNQCISHQKGEIFGTLW